MKKIISMLSFSLFLFLLVPLAHAAGTVWDVKGNYTLSFVCTSGCSGTYNHALRVTSADKNTGDFSGNGNYIANPSYTWTITGNVSGSDVTYTIIYTGTLAGYTLHGTGTIDTNGAISGTATDSLKESFTFHTTTGMAKATFSTGEQLEKGACHGIGTPVIDVVQRVTGDADSGFGGFWAYDTYNRMIKVWKTDSSKFCATVTYHGRFKTIIGQRSPANQSTFTQSKNGEMEGGYRSTEFSGTLHAQDPSHWPIYGAVMPIPFDYQCDIHGNCANRIDWTSKYFTDLSGFDLTWWGWKYTASPHQQWINSSTGNAGDIQ